MNKKGIGIIIISIIILTAFFACQKIDNNKIPPVIQLKGSNPMQVILGCEFVDPGVSLTDDKDPPAAIKIYHEPSEIPDSTGTYYINYTAVDSDSNRAFVQRKVVVEPLVSADYAGTYNVSDTIVPLGGVPSVYVSTVVVRSAYPQWIEILNFNNFGQDFKAYFTHDSSGTIQVNYDLSDTVISGNGFTYCDKTGFRLIYNIDIAGNDTEFHRSTFLLTSQN
jgi:hypothetical protein